MSAERCALGSGVAGAGRESCTGALAQAPVCLAGVVGAGCTDRFVLPEQ